MFPPKHAEQLEFVNTAPAPVNVSMIPSFRHWS